MNLAERIKQAQEQNTKLIVTAGLRFGGKTAGLGTLPGKTLLGVAKDKESGAQGAVKVANENGNTLDYTFIEDASDAVGVARAAFEAGYDNVAIDGTTAITEIEAEKPKIKKQLTAGGNSVFGAWRAIGTEVVTMIQELKKLSAEYNKPVVLTLALKDPKADATGNYAPLDPDVKGQMALSEIKGKCPYFVCARAAADSEGNTVYVLQTSPDDLYPARLDGVLAKDLPKGFRTEVDKVEEGGLVGYAALLDFLSGYQK
jgi:hypothetical protein